MLKAYEDALRFDEVDMFAVVVESTVTSLLTASNKLVGSKSTRQRFDSLVRFELEVTLGFEEIVRLAASSWLMKLSIVEMFSLKRACVAA